MNKLVKYIFFSCFVTNIPAHAFWHEVQRGVAELQSKRLRDEVAQSDSFTMTIHRVSKPIEQWVTQAVNSFGVSGNIDTYVDSTAEFASAHGARSVRVSPNIASFIALDAAKQNNPKLWYPWSKKSNIQCIDHNNRDLSSSHLFFQSNQFKSAFSKKYLVKFGDIDQRSLIRGILAHEAGHLKHYDSASILLTVAQSLTGGTIALIKLGVLIVGGSFVTGIGATKCMESKDDKVQIGAVGAILGAMTGFGIAEVSSGLCNLKLKATERAADANVPNDPELLFANYQWLNQNPSNAEDRDYRKVGGFFDLSNHPSDQERAAYFKKRYEEYMKNNSAESK